MAEAATILAILNGLGKTTNFCFQVLKRAYIAPDEIQRLNGEASNWRPQLESLAELMDGDNQSANRLREKFKDGGLVDVKNLVDELNRVLEPFQRPSLRQRFKWSATTGDQVKELLSQLQREMGIIMGSLHIETHLSLVGLHREIRQIQLFETNEHERRNILEWLKPEGIDPHDFHRHKRALREEGTCDWLANSAPWLDWCDGGSPINSRFLWIYGLPGAGKTVLASFAIDHVTAKYQNKGVAYYYCSHERHKKGHTSSEEACSMLRWIIRDLTAQVTRPQTKTTNRQAIIPKTLEDLYVKHDFSAETLLDCLLAVTEYIAMEFKQQVCIIVDAVDESPAPRRPILNVLTTIGTDPRWQHVSLCFTSRKEQDIEKAIEDIQPTDPSYSTPPVQRHKMRYVSPAASASPSSPSSPSTSTGGRNILPAKGPSGTVVGMTYGHETGSSVQSAFDGASSSRNDMPPPPRGGDPHARGRSPSGIPPGFSSHRTSRSEIRRPSGATATRHSGQERATSMGPDPMDVDSPPHADPPVVTKGCSILSMDHNPEVKEAIRTFVRSQLCDEITFRGDDEDLEKAIDLIANKAKGMFRWAACQVDIIIRSDLGDMDSISGLLEQIPPDIFGTYDHMIAKLLPDGHGANEDDRKFARTALSLICSPSSEVPCAEVLVEASLFDVPRSSTRLFNLERLQKILGCLITVTSLPRYPESSYNRAKEQPQASKQVSLAHYTVKEYLFDKSTALGKVKEFALSTESMQNLELRVIFEGLLQFGSHRHDAKWPTRYEEYCLKMSDKALKNRRDQIIREETVWKRVTECLMWDSKHHLQKWGAFPNTRVRAAFPSWTKTSPFEARNEPKVPETSVLVSLLLLQWPELAKVYLADLPQHTKREIWKDRFEVSKGFRVDGTDPTSLMQLCVTRRDVDFLQALIDSRADFSGENELIMDLFYHAYGHKGLDDVDGGAKTGQMLKMLLERGVPAEASGYIFTPLQFAVSNLEDRWVHDLLYEGANANATGDKDGVHPFGEGYTYINGRHTPLQICKETRPLWQTSDEDDQEPINDARRAVEFLLRQWGAEDTFIVVDSD